MRPAWEYVGMRDEPLEGAMALVGIPSTTMVGPLAAALLVEHLGMRAVGGWQSPLLPPVGVVRKGRVVSPVQVWATDQACGPDGRCDRLLVVRSDLAIPPAAMHDLADALVLWAKEQRLAMMVGIEGFPVEEPGAKPAPMVAMSHSGDGLADQLKVQAVQEGILVGFPAAVLLRANRHQFPALAAFAPLHGAEDEAAGALQLLRLLDPLLPHIDLAPAKLAKEAESARGRMSEERQREERAAKRLEDQAARGYT